jgi:branched-chain amino acid transport system substrate-binding protein
MKFWTISARIALLASIAASAASVQAEQVLVGQVAPLSGLDANQGRAYGIGMQLYFTAANKTGVNGHTFKLIRKDDGGRPEDTVALTRQLLTEDKPLVLAGYFGARNVTELVATGLLDKEGIALVGYRASEIRPETTGLYSVRAGLKDEITKIVEHLSVIGISRLGVFYEDNTGAPLALQAVEAAAKIHKATIVAKASYPAGSTKIGVAVKALSSASPQAILMISTGAAAAAFIESYRGEGGAAQLFGTSGIDVEQLTKRLGDEQMQGVSITQVTPTPYRNTGRLSREFIDATKTASLEVQPSYAMMEGYIAAKVIAEAVRRHGGKPSRSALIAALDDLDNFDLGGYQIGFKPNARTGSKYVEMTIISSGKIRQ